MGRDRDRKSPDFSDLSRELFKLRDRIAEASKAADKARGALEQLKDQLKERFGVDNLEEAEKALEKLKKTETKVGADFQEQGELLQEKYTWEK
jgi:predicted transcriptional regulator